MKVLGRKSGCRAVAHDLWDYVGANLPENALERVEKHLAGCPACRVEVEGIRRAQSLLTDCRRDVPAPRSDWRDLQNRMRAGGMISPLTGRVLTQPIGQEAVERPVRRTRLAVDWNRLSLAGSVAATLILSVSIYRLTTAPALNFTPNQTATVPSLSEAHGVNSSKSNGTPDSHFAIGDINPLLIQVSAAPGTTIRQSTPHRPVPRIEPETPAEDEEKSPIVWNNKPEPAQSSGTPRKYVARSTPKAAEKIERETHNAVPPLIVPQEGKDAKTRYIMRGLTPASYLEKEDGIY